MCTETGSTITADQQRAIVNALCTLAANGAQPEQLEATRAALVKEISAINSSPLA